MTIGGMETLYKNIKELQDKLTISKYFGVKKTAVFEQYIETVRRVRNICAHGGILFDLSLPKGITNGPAGRFSIHHSHKLTATIQVIEFLLQTVSKNRVKDMQQDIKEALDRAISKNPKLKSTIIATTGISL
jgi:abortive infection bacteriophage resistance protein